MGSLTIILGLLLILQLYNIQGANTNCFMNGKEYMCGDGGGYQSCIQSCQKFECRCDGTWWSYDKYKLKAPAECTQSEGFFKVTPESDQCFKFVIKSVQSWEDSKKLCEDNNLELAKPKDPVALRKYMFEIKDYETRLPWLGARGGISSGLVEWNRDGVTISSGDPLWWPGQPGSSTSDQNCLSLMVGKTYLERHPDKPYWMRPCSVTDYYALCELVG